MSSNTRIDSDLSQKNNKGIDTSFRFISSNVFVNTWHCYYFPLLWYSLIEYNPISTGRCPLKSAWVLKIRLYPMVSLLTKNESKLIKLPDDNGWYNKLKHFTGYYQIFLSDRFGSFQWFNIDFLLRGKHFDWKSHEKGQPQFTAHLSIEKTIYLLSCSRKMWLL